MLNTYRPSKDSILEVPIENEELLLTVSLEGVDRVGFDLTTLEQEYYKANKLELSVREVLSKDSKKDSWNTIFQKWILDSRLAENTYVDHSGLYGVYPFKGRAAEQLKKYLPKRPELAKLLNLKGKVGYDICIDYIEDTTVVELVHIEHDFGLDSYKLFLEGASYMEERILATDWNGYLREAESVGVDLANPINHDLKARFFGFPKAFMYYNRL
jgi:hypothetical protein